MDILIDNNIPENTYLSNLCFMQKFFILKLSN